MGDVEDDEEYNGDAPAAAPTGLPSFSVEESDAAAASGQAASVAGGGEEEEDSEYSSESDGNWDVSNSE